MAKGCDCQICSNANSYGQDGSDAGHCVERERKANHGRANHKDKRRDKDGDRYAAAPVDDIKHWQAPGRKHSSENLKCR